MDEEKNLKSESEEDITEENAASGKNDENESIEEAVPENKKGKIAMFFSNLSASVIDTIVISAVSAVLLYICDYIMRYTIGLYISDKVGFLFIIFIVVTVLYPCFMETFGGKTLGKGLMKLK